MTMTPRQRMLAILRGQMPDHVPAAPDFSNMVPCRLTGRPFWQVYLYRDPPIWEAHRRAAEHFDIDALSDGFFPLVFLDERPDGPPTEEMIVRRTDERIVTQRSWVDDGKRRWADGVNVYYIADSPTYAVPPEKIGLPPVPERWEPVEGRREVDTGPDGFQAYRNALGERGVAAVALINTFVMSSPEQIIQLYRDTPALERIRDERIEKVERRWANILTLDPLPDLVTFPGSGTLIFQTPEIFQKYALPAVKRGIELAHAAGVPTHMHSCGPERELVRIMAEETELDLIDPLEVPPMGDCDLADLKRRWGGRLALKGNLHTTEVMLRGTPETVAAASRAAIDAAAAGGGFVLSTGDQCGRDTPEENLRAMVETARTYGKY